MTIRQMNNETYLGNVNVKKDGVITNFTVFTDSYAS